MQNRVIDLIESSIKNGRIYFPTTDAKFFPADSFADREGSGHKGNAVVFTGGTHRFTGPIRVFSGQRLSPQRSFSKYLKDVGAKAGDSLLVTRWAEREYLLEHRAAP